MRDVHSVSGLLINEYVIYNIRFFQSFNALYAKSIFSEPVLQHLVCVFAFTFGYSNYELLFVLSGIW